MPVTQNDAENYTDEGGPISVASELLDRREALLKIVRTTAYAAPMATMLLVGSKDAKAGAPPVS